MGIIVSRKHIYAQYIYKKYLLMLAMCASVFINYTEIYCINIMWNPMIHHLSWPKQAMLHSFHLLQDVYCYLNQIWHAKYCEPALKQQHFTY